MFRLTIEDKQGGVADQYSFEEGEFFIGRSQASDIELPSDNVSRKHARLYTVEGRCYIEDLQSANGVFVNGRRITEVYAISRTAKVKIGDYFLHIEALTEEDEAPVFFRLVGLSEPMTGETVTVDKRVSLLGRGKECAIVVVDKSVSRVHSRLTVERSGTIHVEDLKSSNGTWVNETRVESSNVRDGDLVRFGNVEFRLEVPATAAAGVPAGAGGPRVAEPPAARAPSAVARDIPAVAPRRIDAPSTRQGVPHVDDEAPRGGGVPWAKLGLGVAALGLLAAGVWFFALREATEAPVEAELAKPAAPAGPSPEELASRKAAEIRDTLAVGQERVKGRQWDLAVESFERVLALEPTHEEARTQLNQARVWKGDLERLEKARESAREFRLGEAATVLRGIDVKSAYHVEAQDELKKLVGRVPAMILQAENSYRQKDCATATKTLQEALIVDPENTVVPKKQAEFARRCK
jgi:pSer/pThr/pTyr-binding forkhead associated (FHA) protein